MNAWHFFKDKKPAEGSICAVVVKQEIPFYDPVFFLLSMLLKWNGEDWEYFGSKDTKFAGEVVRWMFVTYEGGHIDG